MTRVQRMALHVVAARQLTARELGIEMMCTPRRGRQLAAELRAAGLIEPVTGRGSPYTLTPEGRAAMEYTNA